MKAIIKTFFWGFIWLTLGCKKEDKSIVENPPTYSQGQNSGMGFKINGMDWWANRRKQSTFFPDFSGSVPNNPGIVFGGKGSEMSIKAHFYPNPSNKNVKQFFSLTFDRISDTGVYYLGSSVFENTVAFEENTDPTNLVDTCRNIRYVSSSWPTSYPRQFGRGQVHITYLPRDKRYVSGRFWADLCRPGCDTIRIRDGVFDLSY